MEDDAKTIVVVVFFCFMGLCVLMGASVRGCDNDRKSSINRYDNARIVKVECLKAGKDPLACNLMQ